MTKPLNAHDLAWIAGLERAKASTRYAPVELHCYTRLRNLDGVAPVVLLTEAGCYLRVPASLEAAFELCLHKLNGKHSQWPAAKTMTLLALLANRATEALKLPGCYIPTPGVLELTPLPQEIAPQTVTDPGNTDDIPVSPASTIQHAEEAPIEGCGTDDCDHTTTHRTEQSEIHTPERAAASPLPLQMSEIGCKCLDSRPPISKKERKRASQQARRRESVIRRRLQGHFGT